MVSTIYKLSTNHPSSSKLLVILYNWNYWTPIQQEKDAKPTLNYIHLHVVRWSNYFTVHNSFWVLANFHVVAN